MIYGPGADHWKTPAELFTAPRATNQQGENTMANLTPIETLYGGVKFRSKLEAQWAMYFDLIGAKWEYEPQPFRLSTGKVYVPDFIIRNVRLVHWRSEEELEKYPLRDVYVEVKPVNYDDRIQKAFQFIRDDSGEEETFKIHEHPLYFVGPMPVHDLEEIWEVAHGSNPFYKFEGIDDDEFPGVIGAASNGQVGIFGGDSNYTCFMNEEATMEAFKKVRRNRFCDRIPRPPVSA